MILSHESCDMIVTILSFSDPSIQFHCNSMIWIQYDWAEKSLMTQDYDRLEILFLSLGNDHFPNSLIFGLFDSVPSKRHAINHIRSSRLSFRFLPNDSKCNSEQISPLYIYCNHSAWKRYESCGENNDNKYVFEMREALQWTLFNVK